jgi:hypothetical protein
MLADMASSMICRAMTVCCLVAFAGCQSDRVASRAYKLQHPETETMLINSVLDDEWRQHSVQSSSRVTDEGFAVVTTTPRAHSKIQAGLADARK